MEDNRMKKFMADRFGMFIHWGLYAIPARGEWVRSKERLSIEDYQPFFDTFDPVDYHPVEWAKLARKAGMKYAVMTAKHHDGFCMFDSKLTDYKCTNTKAGRDLIREFADAFRAEGIKVGFYYSLLDWHHPDYPTYHDMNHPMRDNESFRDVKQDFSRYVDYFHGQVRELLTNYGKVDIMWFDFSYKDEVNDMSGEKWHAKELVEMARNLQPGIILDNRLTGSGDSDHYDMRYGDFASPEQILPRRGIVDPSGRSIPWEACVTLNNNWGYCADDHDYKQPKDIVHALVECVSKNGNLLLNVGPDARGNIPDESVRILEEVGKWMDKNGRSIYNCGASGYEKPEWGRFTQNGDRLYAHVFERGVGAVCLENMAGKIGSARILKDGSEVSVAAPWNAKDNEKDAFLDFRSYRLPDDIDTVVELTLI